MALRMTVLVLLAACSMSLAVSARAETPLQKLEASGELPVLDRSDSMAGSDENQNFIRDDIDAYIGKQGYTEPQRKAATQLAREFQQAVIAGGEQALATDKAKPIALRMSRAINCIYSVQPETAARSVETYKSLTTNTKKRLKSYLRYSKALDGTAGGIPHGDTCEKDE